MASILSPIGISIIAQLEAALDALARGPLPSAAVSKLELLWANEFKGGEFKGS